MIDLYYWSTGNNHKVVLFLEEANVPYNIIPINIMKGEQFGADFLKVSPNNRVPAIVDHDPTEGGPALSVFESGAILLYLAEKYEAFIPRDTVKRYKVIEWLFWQMAGLGPMSGQNFHFRHYAAEKIPYAIERYGNETRRLYGVLDKQLADSEFMCGSEYTIADMASYPWIVPHERQGQNLDDFPNIRRWFESIRGRDATRRCWEIAEQLNPGLRSAETEEERRILFGLKAEPSGKT